VSILVRRDLPAYRPGRSVAGALKLSSNELPWGPLPSVQAAINLGVPTANRYPDHRATALRERLAGELGVGREQVTVGAGAVGLLQQLALAFVGPGDRVVRAEPSFEAYPVFTALARGHDVAVPLRRLTIDAARLAEAIDERTRLVLVAQPNNPTGTALAAAELAALADSLPPDCLLVIDEAYREFVTGRHLPDGLDLAVTHPQVVVLRTFSKAHGLAALRVGYAVAAPDVVEALDRVLLPFAVGALGQAAAIASLDAHGELVERVATVVAERERVCTDLRGAGWSVPASEANFVWLPAGQGSDALASRLESAGIVARTFSGLGLRVTVADSTDNDHFVQTFLAQAPTILEQSWGLPVGDNARRVQAWLDRLCRVEDRLIRPSACRRDPGGDAGVWGPIAASGAYWIGELEKVMDGWSLSPPPSLPPAPDRRPIPASRSPHWRAAQATFDHLRAVIASASPEAWAAVGMHPTLGPTDAERILAEQLIGPWEDHAARLTHLHA
jgi:histidinol-phosphate aminotransferase